MKKELLILRHAKSDWSADFIHDRERPLNKRGKIDAQLIGKWMAQKSLLPDLIFCSPAKRASKTLEPVLQHFDTAEIKTNYPESLYLADLTTLLETIRNVPDTTQRLLLVGHNPGLDELLLYLSNHEPPYTKKGKLMTTANLAILELSASYQRIPKHSANLRTLIRPDEL